LFGKEDKRISNKNVIKNIVIIHVVQLLKIEYTWTARDPDWLFENSGYRGGAGLKTQQPKYTPNAPK
jgi:hypothetical protein